MKKILANTLYLLIGIIGFAIMPKEVGDSVAGLSLVVISIGLII